MTDHHAIRYAPNSHPHLSLDGHIYEEIPSNYPAAAFCFNPTATLAAHNAYPRYAVYCDDGSAAAMPPLSTQSFDQRRSWLDLLHRPPCPDVVFNHNLYNDGTKITPPCPCPCYYPSLPQNSSRMAVGTDARHVMVNPVEREIPEDGTRRGSPYENHIRPTPYNRRYSNRNDLLNSRFYPNDLLNPGTVYDFLSFACVSILTSLKICVN